ncbi:MAG TPA: hypothetical protein PLW93_01780 [Candidatus Absconditabacterales bacterium]|nr:hypothetical protein [Candidatus Absconditabacterales bacterium]HNG96980.1 hypothetical protein [Candidatus Absconditabacterales bacterium]
MELQTSIVYENKNGDRSKRYHKYIDPFFQFINQRGVKTTEYDKAIFKDFCTLSAVIDDLIDMNTYEYDLLLDILSKRLGSDFTYQAGFFGGAEEYMRSIIDHVTSIHRRKDFQFWILKGLETKKQTNDATHIKTFIKARYANGSCFMRAIGCLFDLEYEHIFISNTLYIGLSNLFDSVIDMKGDIQKGNIHIKPSFKNYQHIIATGIYKALKEKVFFKINIQNIVKGSININKNKQHA